MEATRKIGKNTTDIDALEKLPYHKKEVILKRKYSVMTTIKKQNVGLKQSEMESDLLTYIQKCTKRNVRVTRLIIFKKVTEFCPLFKGGIESAKFFASMKGWFYQGFKPRYNLRYVRISGASRKLPHDWEDRSQSNITRVARTQMTQCVDGITTPAVKDNKFSNTNHVPVYRDNP